jgi:hypothetical protein
VSPFSLSRAGPHVRPLICFDRIGQPGKFPPCHLCRHCRWSVATRGNPAPPELPPHRPPLATVGRITPAGSDKRLHDNASPTGCSFSCKGVRPRRPPSVDRGALASWPRLPLAPGAGASLASHLGQPASPLLLPTFPIGLVVRCHATRVHEVSGIQSPVVRPHPPHFLSLPCAPRRCCRPLSFFPCAQAAEAGSSRPPRPSRPSLRCLLVKPPNAFFR